MRAKQKLSIKVKAKISLHRLGKEYITPKRGKIQRRWVKGAMQSGKVKYFSFSVFYNKTESYKKRRNNIITTK